MNSKIIRRTYFYLFWKGCPTIGFCPIRAHIRVPDTYILQNNTKRIQWGPSRGRNARFPENKIWFLWNWWSFLGGTDVLIASTVHFPQSRILPRAFPKQRAPSNGPNIIRTIEEKTWLLVQVHLRTEGSFLIRLISKAARLGGAAPPFKLGGLRPPDPPMAVLGPRLSRRDLPLRRQISPSFVLALRRPHNGAHF